MLEGSALGRPLGSGQCRIATVLLSEAIGANGGAVCDGRLQVYLVWETRALRTPFRLDACGFCLQVSGETAEGLPAAQSQRTCCASWSPAHEQQPGCSLRTMRLATVL